MFSSFFIIKRGSIENKSDKVDLRVVSTLTNQSFINIQHIIWKFLIIFKKLPRISAYNAIKSSIIFSYWNKTRSMKRLSNYLEQTMSKKNLLRQDYQESFNSNVETLASN